MKKFSEAKAVVRLILDAKGLVKVRIFPGPILPENPNYCVVLTRYGGAGLDADGALDVIAWQVRSIGKQNNYDSAEEIADTIDDGFLNHFSSYVFPNPEDLNEKIWVPSITRVGGAPNPLLVDDADRTHFVCSYNASTQSALIN